MTDAFDLFLSDALKPPEREPDRAFVSAVQARIAIERRLAVERSALLSKLLIQLIAMGAVAAAVGWIARAPEVAALAGESPHMARAILLVGFGLLVALFAAVAGGRSAVEYRILRPN